MSAHQTTVLPESAMSPFDSPSASVDPDRPIYAGNRVWKLTPQVAERICRSIALGITIRASCLVEGVSETTFRRWMRNGETAQAGAQRDFYLGVKEAEAIAEYGWTYRLLRLAGQGVTTRFEETTEHPELGEITRRRTQTVGSGDVRAIEHYLSRRFPKDWAHPDSAHRLGQVDTAGDVAAVREVRFEFKHTRSDSMSDGGSQPEDEG